MFLPVPDEESPGEMEIFGRNFAIGDEAGIQMEADEDDVAEISAVVCNASRLADFTIATIHAHEHAGRWLPTESWAGKSSPICSLDTE